jgi:hypothetical protein
MPATQDPNLGLFNSWDLGEFGWNTGMDANFKKLGALVMFSVISATTTAQPATPSEGDRYIVPTSATGADWAGQDGKFAIYSDGNWAFYAPSKGWKVQAEDTYQEYLHNGTLWSNMIHNNIAADGSISAQGNVSAIGSVVAGAGGITSSGNIEGDTNDSINLGSITKRFLNIHGFWGFFTGLLTASGGIAAGPITTSSNLTHSTDGAGQFFQNGSGINRVSQVWENSSDELGFATYTDVGEFRDWALKITRSASGLITIGGTRGLLVPGLLTASGGIATPITKWHYWGDETTDGSWRQGVVSGDFVTQLRISGTWTTKQTVLA